MNAKQKSQLDALATAYGNAMFNCGEAPENAAYDEISRKADEARQALLKFVEQLVEEAEASGQTPIIHA